MQLAASISEIKRNEQQEKAKKQGSLLAEQRELAPAAVSKLASKNGDVNKLTIKEISAILLVSYSVEYPQGAARGIKKLDYVTKLQEVIQEQGPPSVPATLASQAAESDRDSDDEEPFNNAALFEEDS